MQKIKYTLGLVCWVLFLFLSLWHANKIYSQLFASLGIFACLMALSASPSNSIHNKKSKWKSDLKNSNNADEEHPQSTSSI